ncbi:MAG: ATP-binding protein [Desulfobacterales bacterium]|nr:ATP-binding protein [Desulfobacterales bacterium]
MSLSGSAYRLFYFPFSLVISVKKTYSKVALHWDEPSNKGVCVEKDINVEKIERLNLVLNAIREVGRLLVKENHRERLIKGICDILVARRGYFNAWIGLLDEDQNVVMTADSGFDGKFEAMEKRLDRREFTRCIRATLESEEVYAVQDPVVECTNCVLAENYSGRGAIAVALAYENIRYGFMVLSTPKRLAMDDTERSIIKEVADDIAMGLYRMELEEKRKLAEKSRERSQARFKILIENSLNYISIIQDHTIVYKNHGLRKVHSLMDRVFEPPKFLQVYEGDRDRIQKKYRELVAGRISSIEADFQYYPVMDGRENAELRWALLSARKINYLGVESVLTNIMDITDSKEVQSFLRIQDKMTSLGRVTAGIAHEIRNPLSGIYIYLKALKQIYNQMGDITRVVSIIGKIELASNKIESIIQRVMDFSKPSRPQFVMADLNRYIDEVTKLTAVTLRKSGIRLIKDLDPDLPECYAEPHLIEQVILNLVTNAAEAMKEVEGEKSIGLYTGLDRKKENIIISVRDTGPGIPHAHQSKIFDPFYTTKANSSGIGLSICHRIILDHGGTLKFSAQGSGGAQFTIELPLGSGNNNEADRDT